MQYTKLGKTGLKVSRLGFGCMRFPMQGTSVDREKTIPMLRHAVDLGINYFDTAVVYNYGDSQRALGEAMEPIRDQVILSTKNHHYDKNDEKGWHKNLEDSLDFLRTDYIDIYNFHDLSWARFENHVDGPDAQLAWALRAKEEGKIRHLCISSHETVENIKKLASTGYFESITLQYNILDPKNEAAFQHISKKCGMGIVVMGPVGGGRLGGESEEIRNMLPGSKSVPETALRFVLSNPYVSIALSGMQNMEQLEANVKVGSRKTPLSSTEKRRVKTVLNRFKKLSDLYCTGCNYCMPCPSGVNIPANFMALNYDRVYGLPEAGKGRYGWLGSGAATYCIGCGKCLAKCPQDIKIIDQLRDVVRAYDDNYGHVLADVKPLDLKAVKKSGASRRAVLSARLNLKSLVDDDAAVAVSFSPSRTVSVKPTVTRKKLRGFGRASVAVEIECPLNGKPVRTGAAIDVGHEVNLNDEFCMAVAPRSSSWQTKAAREAMVIRLNHKDQIAEGNERALKTHGANVRFAYDDNNLYVKATIKDDVSAPASARRAANATDRLELCLDARPRSRFGRMESWDEQVAMVGILAPGKGKEPTVSVHRPKALELPCSGKQTASGWSVETAIPWSIVGLKKAVRKHLGVQVELVSHTRTGKTQVKLYWSGTQHQSRPDQYGHLFLK